ncbi:MFS transporter [Puniceibacterium sediminis]
MAEFRRPGTTALDAASALWQGRAMGMLHDLHRSRGPAAAFAAMGLFWGSFAALVPAIKPQVGLSDGAFGLALLVAASGAVMAMWLAPLAERLLGQRAMAICTALMALAFLLPGWMGGGLTFALAMTLASASSGTLDVVMNARVSALEATEKRSLMNLNHGMFSVAYACAAIAAGLGREAGMPPGAVLGLMSAIALMLTLFILRCPVPAPEEDSDETAHAYLPWALLLPGGAIILIAFLSEQATEGWSALHLERNLGAGAAQGALGPAILGITMAAGRLSGQLVAQRLSEARVIFWAALVAATGALLAAHAPTLSLAYAGFAILGAGVSVLAPMAFAWIGRMVPARHRTKAISRVSVVGYAGFFIGPPLMGFLSEGFGLQASFSAIALGLLIVPALLIPALHRRSQNA